MDRRTWIVGAVGLLAAPRGAHAQPAGKVYRVATIYENLPVSVGVRLAAGIAFRRALGELGYVEGKNLVLEYRSLEGRIERVPEIVAELGRLGVDVIVTTANPVTLRVKQATSTIPIVMGTSGTPVEAGLVQSLARPGGNVTGLTVDGGPESEGKRLALLRGAVPGISRAAFTSRVQALGILEVKTTPRSPWQNPYVERFIGTLRRECLDHMVVLSATHLRLLLRDYLIYYHLIYYHSARTHLSLDKDAPEPRAVERLDQGRIVETPLVGGLHHRYSRRGA
jgi:hypothetical protein